MIPPENREKRDNTSNNLSGNSLVPDDVVIEILLRLPVKSLLRCKSVCKSWFGLIKSSNFISKHHHHENNHTRILVHHHIHDDAGKQRYIFSLFTDEPHSRQDLNYLHMPELLFRHVIGSYDGLVLLCDGTELDHPQMALWNPATRELKPLPIPKSNLPPHFQACECSFGFGWDPLGNDYKVVLISKCYDRRNAYPIDWVFSVAVYTLGSESWRHLDPFLLPGRVIHNSLCVTCVNGAYYWLTSDDPWTCTILLFDMGSEVVREIPGPDNLKEEAGLVLYNGSIAMLLYNYSGETVEFVDIWVMKQEGCWIKHLTIGPLQDIAWPRGIWRNELFMIAKNSHLVFYNPTTNETRDYRIRGLHIYSLTLFVLSYKESLVSVNGGNKDFQKDSFSDLVHGFFKGLYTWTLSP